MLDCLQLAFGSIIQTTNGKYIVSSSTRNPIWNNYSDLTITELGINGNIISTTKDIVLENPNKKLLKIVDVLGREVLPTSNTPLFYIYDDGTVEKRIIIE